MYRAHCAVIFAIAQLSCNANSSPYIQCDVDIVTLLMMRMKRHAHAASAPIPESVGRRSSPAVRMCSVTGEVIARHSDDVVTMT